jgi:hypothetical protein
MVKFCTLLGLLFAASRTLSMAEIHWVYSITRAAAGMRVRVCVRERERENFVGLWQLFGEKEADCT